MIDDTKTKAETMYLLILSLPFDTILVQKQDFETETEALAAALLLPDGFEVVKASEFERTGHVIGVPIKQPKSEDKNGNQNPANK
jgi:hypothetical protein